MGRHCRARPSSRRGQRDSSAESSALYSGSWMKRLSALRLALTLTNSIARTRNSRGNRLAMIDPLPELTSPMIGFRTNEGTPGLETPGLDSTSQRGTRGANTGSYQRADARRHLSGTARAGPVSKESGVNLVAAVCVTFGVEPSALRDTCTWTKTSACRREGRTRQLAIDATRATSMPSAHRWSRWIR